MITCSNCSTSLNEGTKFCTNCGAAVEPAKVEVAAEVSVNCAKCGATLAPGGKFCLNCGAPTTVVEVVEEVAVAQPAAPVPSTPEAAAAAVAVTPTAETSGPAPLYALSTPQGYRCPTCQAFLQPGSVFCAGCGSRFAQAVPYGGQPHRSGMSPAIPIVVAILVLGGGFAGWWFLGRGGDNTAVTPGTTNQVGTVDRNDQEAPATTEASEAEAAAAHALNVFNAIWKGEGVGAMYDMALVGDVVKSRYPSRDSFVADFEMGLGANKPAFEALGPMINNISVGEATVVGNKATVPISFTLDSPVKGPMNLTATARLIKDGNTWKLDFTGGELELQTNMLDMMGMTEIARLGGLNTPPPSTSGETSGSTGNFEPNTGTTGMGTSGSGDDY